MDGKRFKNILFLCLAFLPTILLSSGIESSRHLKIKDCLLVPDEVSEQVLLLDFTKDAKWDEVVNFGNRLNTGYGEKLGNHGFFLSGPKATEKAAEKRSVDTAWQVWSSKFPVRGMSELVGNIDIFSNRSFKEIFAPHWENYVNSVHWYSADGKSLGRTAFPVMIKKQGLNPIAFRITVPEHAVEGRLSLGADSPNLGASDILLITRIRIGGIPFEGARCFTDGEAILPPICFAPNKPLCSISADTPEGSSITAEIAFAADKDGIPAQFSSFVPINHPIPKDTAWVKCRVKFLSDGKLRPALRSVTICGKNITGWKSLTAEKSALIRRVSKSPSHDPNQAFVFSVNHDLPINWRTLRVILDGSDITADLKRVDIASEQPALEAASFTFAPKKPFAMQSVHKAIVSFADIYGKSFSKPLYFFFDEPLKKGIVTIRDDGLLLLDGKPFFPIGPSYVKPLPENENSLDNAYAWLKKAGFNTICADPIRGGRQNFKRYKAYLDKIAKYGIKVYLQPGNSKGANCQDIDAILETVAEYYRHPALLAWYIGDDTVLHNTPEQMEMKTEAIRSIDPYHPTCQADAVLPYHPPVFSPVAGADDTSRYRPMVNATDIFRAELYPVRNHTEKNAKDCVPSLISSMRTIQRDIRDKAASPKSIWGIVQYFEGWNKTVEKSTWKRYPTWQELRAMTWGSAIYGAKGLNWYSYHYYPKMFAHGFMYKEETRRNMLRMIGEIVPLVNVLVERDNVPTPNVSILSGPVKDVLGNDSISVMARKHDGYLYIFALNSAFKPVKAQISAPDASNGIVLYENNREIAVKNGTVIDDFMPNEVHIYKLRYLNK